MVSSSGVCLLIIANYWTMYFLFQIALHQILFYLLGPHFRYPTRICINLKLQLFVLQKMCFTNLIASWKFLGWWFSFLNLSTKEQSQTSLQMSVIWLLLQASLFSWITVPLIIGVSCYFFVLWTWGFKTVICLWAVDKCSNFLSQMLPTFVHE